MPKPKRVGEPVQVYLDDRDRDLLDTLAARAELPRSEVLRVALRRLAADIPGTTRSGESFSALLGVLDSARSVPADLAARHDAYLYKVPSKKARRPKG